MAQGSQNVCQIQCQREKNYVLTHIWVMSMKMRKDAKVFLLCARCKRTIEERPCTINPYSHTVIFVKSIPLLTYFTELDTVLQSNVQGNLILLLANIKISTTYRCNWRPQRCLTSIGNDIALGNTLQDKQFSWISPSTSDWHFSRMFPPSNEKVAVRFRMYGTRSTKQLRLVSTWALDSCRTDFITVE